MLRHAARGTALTTGVVGAVLWPCVPGSYDPLALPLSMIARCVSWALLAFVPIGLVWWGRDSFIGRPSGARLLGASTLAAAIMTGAAVVLSAAAFGGVLLALACAMAVGAVIGFRSRSWQNAATGIGTGSVALLNLVALPILILALQLLLFEPAVTANRERLITSAAPLIAQLEQYRMARGEYPESLLSVTTDYPPRSVSVPRFWYERAGAAYNLAFEQVPAALDMREFVVYNPAGNAVLTSHDGDLLVFQGDDLQRRRGFPSSDDVANHPGWRVFRFD